ncbi:hypothetical protein K474DRAFT_1776166 [Panus rudis PR-1116 ss-1]|nr:hypothetical protein K474DRAFT_1776166 [Panus rudis PR-1116 ss-1]
MVRNALYSSPARAVGSSPELVHMILGFLDRKTDAHVLANAIRVNKKWWDIAGGLLWREVTSKELGSLLWPSYDAWKHRFNYWREHKVEDDFEGWASSLSSSDYTRFTQYASFIQSLRHDDSDFKRLGVYIGPRMSRIIQAYLTGRSSPWYRKRRPMRFAPPTQDLSTSTEGTVLSSRPERVTYTFFPRLKHLHWVTDHGKRFTAPRAFRDQHGEITSIPMMLISQWSTFLLILASETLETVHIDWPHHISIPHPKASYDVDTYPHPIDDVLDMDEAVYSDHDRYFSNVWWNARRRGVNPYPSDTPRPHIDILLDFVAKIPKVRRLTIPLLLDAEPVPFLRAVSELQYLEEFSTITGRYKFNSCSPSWPITPEFHPGSWPRLRTFAMHGSLDDIVRILKHPNGPRDLKAVAVRTRWPALRDITAFFDMMARENPQLERLELFTDHVYMSIPENQHRAPIRESPVCIETIQPLLNLHDIKVFRFSCDKRLSLNQRDFELLTSSWPKLEELQLETEILPPSLSDLDTSEPDLNLDVFLSLADHCPDLKKLSISLDARAGSKLFLRPIPLPSLPKLLTVRLLPGLRPFTPIDVPVVIARICPPDVNLSIRFPWSYDGWSTYRDSLPYGERQRYMNHQSIVRRLLGSMMTTHHTLQSFRREVDDVDDRERRAKMIEALESKLAAATASSESMLAHRGVLDTLRLFLCRISGF